MDWKADVGWSDSVIEGQNLVADHGFAAVWLCHVPLKSRTKDAVEEAKKQLLDDGARPETLKIHDGVALAMTGWRLRCPEDRV